MPRGAGLAISIGGEIVLVVRGGCGRIRYSVRWISFGFIDQVGSRVKGMVS